MTVLGSGPLEKGSPHERDQCLIKEALETPSPFHHRSTQQGTSDEPGRGFSFDHAGTTILVLQSQEL